jgi:hypothetical protein
MIGVGLGFIVMFFAFICLLAHKLNKALSIYKFANGKKYYNYRDKNGRFVKYYNYGKD